MIRLKKTYMIFGLLYLADMWAAWVCLMSLRFTCVDFVSI